MFISCNQENTVIMIVVVNIDYSTKEGIKGNSIETIVLEMD